MRRFLVGGNWKCNNTLKYTKWLVNNVVNKCVFNPKKMRNHLSSRFSFLRDRRRPDRRPPPDGAQKGGAGGQRQRPELALVLPDSGASDCAGDCVGD